MDDRIVAEAEQIFRRLSPANQTYVMALAKAAKATEESGKRKEVPEACDSSEPEKES